MVKVDIDQFIFDGVNWLVFCDVGTARFNLATPFHQGGFLYATDGRIVVRRPSDAPDTTDLKLPKKLDSVFVCHKSRRRKRKWPRNRELQHGGISRCPCDIDGDGPCPLCDDTGLLSPQVVIGDSVISFRYWRIVASLPDPYFLPSKSEEAIPFIFDGGEGLLMPMARGHMEDE